MLALDCSFTAAEKETLVTENENDSDILDERMVERETLKVPSIAHIAHYN